MTRAIARTTAAEIVIHKACLDIGLLRSIQPLVPILGLPVRRVKRDCSGPGLGPLTGIAGRRRQALPGNGAVAAGIKVPSAIWY